MIARPRARRSSPALAPLVPPVLAVLGGAALLALGALAVGVVLAVVGILVLALDAAFGAPRRLLARLDTRPAAEASDARLVNLVEGLCVAVGVSQPELRLLEDPARNALVVGTSARAVLICTSGLVEGLDRMELEAVLAHELVHVKRGDAAVAALAAFACGALLPWLPAAARLVARLSGDDREAIADRTGVRLTRYPPALAAALDVVGSGPRRPGGLDPVVTRATAGWWFVPFEEAEPAAPVPGRLDLELRTAALHEL